MRESRGVAAGEGRGSAPSRCARLRCAAALTRQGGDWLKTSLSKKSHWCTAASFDKTLAESRIAELENMLRNVIR